MNTSQIRLTGLSSGLDTDKMIKDLMKIEQLKVDRVAKEKTYVEWQRDAYREQANALKAFQSKFFDVLKPEFNLTTAAGFRAFSTTATISGVSTSKVEVRGTENLDSQKHVVNRIDQLATKDTWKASGKIKGDITTSEIYNVNSLNNAVINGDNSFRLAIDGRYKTITFDEITDVNTDGDVDLNDFAQQLNSKIQEAFGAEYSNIVSVVNVGGTDQLKFEMEGSRLEVVALDNQALTALGIQSGASTGLALNSKLSDVFGTITEDLSKLTINGVAITGITENSTVKELIDKVNNSSAGVQLSYSSLKMEFTLQSKSEGSVNNISLSNSDTTNFFSNHLKIEDGANREKALNAQVTINGVAITRSSNSFTVEGVSYTLKETHTTGESIEISLKPEVDTIFNRIKEFVTDYNKMMEDLSSKLSEKKQYSFKPLTDEEKKAMSEDEVKLWESRAKEGLLRNDNILSTMMDSMRVALYSAVEGVGISLKDIGITTSSNYKERNKLEIDETKLKSAIENNYKDVVALFGKDSSTAYLSRTGRDTRYKESGIAERLNDIINDNIRISRDSYGKRGRIVEKSGIDGIADLDSDLFKRINDYSKRISSMMSSFNTIQNSYYEKFTRMETAMSQLTSQSNWLASQLSSMN